MELPDRSNVRFPPTADLWRSSPRFYVSAALYAGASLKVRYSTCQMECRGLLDRADCLVELVQLGQQGAQVTHVRVVDQTRFKKGPRDIPEAEARIGLAR